MVGQTRIAVSDHTKSVKNDATNTFKVAGILFVTKWQLERQWVIKCPALKKKKKKVSFC